MHACMCNNTHMQVQTVHVAHWWCDESCLKVITLHLRYAKKHATDIVKVAIKRQQVERILHKLAELIKIQPSTVHRSSFISYVVMTSPQAVYIKDRNSGLVLEYKPNSTYEVEIETQTSASTQQWLVLDSGFARYFYIQSKYNEYVISAGDESKDPLYLAPKKDGLDRNQLWILREPCRQWHKCKLHLHEC